MNSVPETLPTMQEVKELIDHIITKCAGENYIFRGTTKVYSKKKEGINSSLYRWAREQEQKQKFSFGKNFKPIDIEKEIVEKARKYFPPKTSNIEILTDLRHYHGNVTLIDFSRDLYVALFFACNGDFEDEGELVVLKTDKLKEIKDINYNEEEPQTKIIEPAITQTSRERTIAQSSVFVSVPTGYFDRRKCKFFKIKKELKQEVIKYLRNFHNIDTGTIYNDLIGFIANEENYVTADTCFYKGIAKGKAKGNAKGNAKKYKGAIKDYDEAIKINPEFFRAYNNRGIAKANLGRYEGALGRYEEAIEDFNKAIEINPQYANAYNNRGVSKGKLERYEEAIEDHDKAIEINPQYAYAYNSRGNAKGKLERYEEAIEDYDKAIEINPQYAYAYNNRGRAKVNLERYEEAIEDYDKAIEINPQYANAYYNRGFAKHYSGKKEEAEKDFNKAIELDPKLKNKKRPS